MIKHITGLVLAALLAPMSWAAQDWLVVADGSHLRFIGSMQGESFTGEFPFEAQIRFDPMQAEQSAFDVRIEVVGADSQNQERDQALAGPEWFDFARHPQASYVATSFRADGDHWIADGRLRIREVERDVPLRFSWTTNATGAVLSGSAQLQRLDFQLGTGDWADTSVIANEVKVQVQLELRAAAAD